MLYQTVVNPWSIRAQQTGKIPSRGIVAADPDHDGATAQSGDVARDIARAAQHDNAIAQQNDRHWGLGRNALDRSIKELVKHDIADDKNADVG
jgi:hypothetical protein